MLNFAFQPRNRGDTCRSLELFLWVAFSLSVLCLPNTRSLSLANLQFLCIQFSKIMKPCLCHFSLCQGPVINSIQKAKALRGFIWFLVLFSLQSHNCLLPTLKWMGSKASSKEPACQWSRRQRRGFDPWVRKIPWRKRWQPPQVFLPGESYGQRRLLASHRPQSVRHDRSNLAFKWIEMAVS